MSDEQQSFYDMWNYTNVNMNVERTDEMHIDETSEKQGKQIYREN